MRRLLSLHFAFLLLSFSVFSKDIPVDEARTVAVNFLSNSQSNSLKSASSFSLTLVTSPSAGYFHSSSKKTTVEGQLYYIFNINENDGFIIVSGDDGAVPVLGYSSGRSFDSSMLPPNFKKWLEDYKRQLRYISEHPSEVSRAVKEQWDNLLAGEPAVKKNTAADVGPLLTTRWNQSPYYNDLCPYDSKNGEKAVTGCAATAMAQIMKYWEYPSQGSGFHSYPHDTYGIISANFGSTTFDWASMPDDVTSQNVAVATLMYDCGVSINMDYDVASNGGSGAYVISNRSPVENCVEFALKEYFGYKNSLYGIQRADYATPDWINILKTELEAGRPVEYTGSGEEGGHAFVCDGFDSNDYFHFNWGWGGYADGYFVSDALDPLGTGIGGGSGSYNSNQQALIGIEPPDIAIQHNISLYASISISDDPVWYTQAFDIHTDIANLGTTTFNGEVGMAIFDENYAFVDFAATQAGLSLAPNMHFTDGLTFSNPGLVSLLPGNYNAILCYRAEGGNWMAAKPGSYTNLLPFKVSYSSDIELYSDFFISTGDEITANQPFSVKADIINNGSLKFAGDFQVALYDMQGNFADLIDTRTGATMDPGYYYPDVEFHSNGISVTPGTYLMALLYRPNAGDWTLSGSSSYPNPVKIIVKATPLQPDKYESNNASNTFYRSAGQATSTYC